MYIFTAKFDRKKAVIMVLLLAVILCAIILLAGSRSDSAAEASSFSSVVKTNEERVSYLTSLGWEVIEEPLEEETVLIPKEFTGAYLEYNELQASQGFDLSQYSGLEAIRYSYQITNYPNTSDTIVADLIVYRNEIIAGDVKSTSADGFMQSLSYPK